MTNFTKNAHALLFASTAFGMLGASAAAHALPNASDTDGQPTRVEDVTVTGERQEGDPQSADFTAPLQDTPRSITVIPQDIIERTNATSLQDILRTSPGITFGAGEGGQPLADRPFIRGQSSGNNIFIDGVRDTGGQMREIFNLEQVEVVRGPDSVYSGRGSGGGSINLVSKQPRLETFTAGSLGVGSDNYWRATIDGNWRLGETSALRLNLMGNAGDVPGRDSVDFEHYGVAGALAYGLDTDARFIAGFYHYEADDMPDYGIPLFTKIGVRTTDSGILDVPYDSFYGLHARDYLINEATSYSLQAEFDITDSLTLRNVFRYNETLNDYVVTNPGDGGNITNGGVVNIGGVYWMRRGTKSRWNPTDTIANVTDLFGEFRTGSILHNFNLGLELSRERNRNASYTITTTGGAACPAPMTGFDCTPLYDPNPNDPWSGTIVRGATTTTRTETMALSAFDTIEFNDQWLLNLGVRYDDYSVGNSGWTFTNYQAGLVYRPTDSLSLYVSYGTSSTPPTISAGDQNGGTGTGTGNLATTLLDPEESTNWEAGVKGVLFGGLDYSVSVFQTTRENAQILVAPGVYGQAGEAEVRGLEIGVSGKITPRWEVFGGYAYMDSELVRGAYTNVNVGDPLANTPEHSFSLFTAYDVTERLELGGGLYYVSDSFGGNQGGAGGGTNAVYAPAYTRVDLYGSYQLNDQVEISLNVQNAADEDYVIRTNGVHHADVAPGRQAILRLNVRY